MAIGQKLSSMRYKSFTWEYNPATCTYSCQRSYVSHKYPELAGTEIEDMDIDGIIITGNGEFFGPNAYSNWNKLNAEFKTHGSGVFYHPIFTDVTRALMTKLQANMEPRDNYVSYSFEIVSDMTIDEINTPSVIPPTTSDSSPQQIKVGDVVILTGYAYYDSWGSLPRSEYKNGVKYTVTYVNYKGSHPIHCGSLGWCKLGDVKLSNGSSTSAGSSSSSTKIAVYTVKSGDTLFDICNRYGANWKQIAEYNNIKDPNLIFVGQQIKIPRSMMLLTPPINAASGSKNTTQSNSSKIIAGNNTKLIHTLY